MRTDPSVDAAFASYVNLAARELAHWLQTDASAAAVAAGNDQGAAVLRILRTARDARTDDDLVLMRRVVEHIAAARELRPHGDVPDSRWRHALMNWGHDPVTWSPGPLPAAAVASAARAAPAPRSAAAGRAKSPAPPGAAA